MDAGSAKANDVDTSGRDGEVHLDVARLTTELRLSEGVPKGLSVTFKDLFYDVFPRKGLFGPRMQLTLLKGVSGVFNPGQVTALMGPSGSGKTTLLDVLAGRKNSGKIKGKILYGCEAPTKIFLKRHTGYVEQFDTLVENLTVYEMLLYCADLKLPTSVPMVEKKRRVEQLIDYMDLKKVHDTRIGGASQRGISGGQAKRVNICVSIVTDPHILYLDEPTSGLDSFTSEEVMDAVARLARDGITVCATIHSPTPTIFATFDRLMLLAGGRTVYFGPLGEAMRNYFTQHQLDEGVTYHVGRDAEWVVQMVTGADKAGKIDTFVETYIASDLHMRNMRELQGAPALHKQATMAGAIKPLKEMYPEDAAAPSADSELHAATEGHERELGKSPDVKTVPVSYAINVLLYYRIFRNYMDWTFVSARVLDKAIAAGIILSLFANMGRQGNIASYNNVVSALFMWSAQPSFSAAAYLPTLMLERPLYYRELADGLYSPLTYYLIKWVQELILMGPSTLLFSLMIFFAVGMSGNFFIFWLAFLLCQITAVSTAFMFAILLPNLELANGAVPSFGFTLLFFVGYLIPINQIPPWWIWYSYFPCYLRYPFITMMVNEFSGEAYTINNNTILFEQPDGTPVGLNLTVSVDVYLTQYYGVNGQSIAVNLVALACFGAFFAVAGYVLIRLVRWDRR